MAVICKSYPDY